jgi:hypothetical protein
MRTDDYGHEIAPLNSRKYKFAGAVRLFTFGVALGAGLCVGMGPPLPLFDRIFPTAVASEPAPMSHVLPRQWLVLRNALLDTGVTGISYAQQRQDEDLLRGKWLALQDALSTVWSDRLAAR